jgi:nucleotide-binding universal stress UspA family protein
MDLKTILVHADESRSTDERSMFAGQLAIGYHAHLVGITQTGIMRYAYGVAPDGWDDLTPLFENLRAAAEKRAASFEALARQAGVASFEHRIGDEESGYALASQAMYADLVVVGQSDPADPASAHAAIPEYVALHAPCPVLVVPYAGSFSASFERVVVAVPSARPRLSWRGPKKSKSSLSNATRVSAPRREGLTPRCFLHAMASR